MTVAEVEQVLVREFVREFGYKQVEVVDGWTPADALGKS